MEDELTKAVREWDAATQALTAANKAAKDAAHDVAEKRHVALSLLELRDQRGVLVDDHIVRISELPHGQVTDRAAFEAWARAWDGEAFYEPETRLRKDNLNQIIRERLDNNEPLPPGTSVFIEEKISKRKV